MTNPSPSPNFYQQVYAIVRCIPRGKVSSYGRIATMLGRPRAARAVGYALNALKDRQPTPAVPWQRVINSQGRISTTNRETSANQQAALLRDEGIPVSDTLHVDLTRYLWQGLHWAEIEALLQNEKPT